MKQNNSRLAPVNGKTPALTVEMTIRQAAIGSFAFYYRNMLVNEKGTLENRDPEFLHYLRVSSKRLRVALSIFRPYFRKSEINHFKDEVKTLAPVLGKARDIDVYLKFLRKEALPEAASDKREDIRKYMAFLTKTRNECQVSVVEKIKSARHARFKKRFEAFLGRWDSINRPSKSPYVCRLASDEISQGIHRLVKTSRRLSDNSEDHRLHKFRIKCRKMRYRTELFLSLSGKDGARTVKKLVDVQNALGGHHDSVTAGEKLEHYLEIHPLQVNSPFFRKLRKLQKRRAEKFRKKFFRKLRKL